MRVTARLDGLSAHLVRAVERAEGVVTRAVRAETAGLRDDWRQAVEGAGLGKRLGNTVRMRSYPERETSLTPAGLVWTRAPEIMEAHTADLVIAGKRRSYLALPTEAVPRRSGRGGRMKPAELEARFGRKLRLVARRGRPALLVMDQARASYARADGRFRGFRPSRSKTGRGHTTVVMYVLVKRVRTRKRFDLAQMARRRQDGIHAALQRELFVER